MVMGLFGVAEVVKNIELKESAQVFTGKVGHMMPSKEDWRRMWRPILRGTAIVLVER